MKLSDGGHRQCTQLRDRKQKTEKWQMQEQKEHEASREMQAEDTESEGSSDIQAYTEKPAEKYLYQHQ